jgi:hypothetical protein
MMIYGPNSTTGHSSVILASENMIDYAFKIIGPVLRGEASEVEVKENAEIEYTKKVQTASSQRIFSTCHNVRFVSLFRIRLYLEQSNLDSGM